MPGIFGIYLIKYFSCIAKHVYLPSVSIHLLYVIWLDKRLPYARPGVENRKKNKRDGDKYRFGREISLFHKSDRR